MPQSTTTRGGPASSQKARPTLSGKTPMSTARHTRHRYVLSSLDSFLLVLLFLSMKNLLHLGRRSFLKEGFGVF